MGYPIHQHSCKKWTPARPRNSFKIPYVDSHASSPQLNTPSHTNGEIHKRTNGRKQTLCVMETLANPIIHSHRLFSRWEVNPTQVASNRAEICRSLCSPSPLKPRPSYQSRSVSLGQMGVTRTKRKESRDVHTAALEGQTTQSKMYHV